MMRLTVRFTIKWTDDENLEGLRDFASSIRRFSNKNILEYDFDDPGQAAAVEDLAKDTLSDLGLPLDRTTFEFTTL